jgi:hypothetical protein
MDKEGISNPGGGVEARRFVPRFEVVTVQVWGRLRYAVIDHLTKAHRFPLDPFSEPQAEGLCALLATKARENKEALTVDRPVSALYTPPPKREKGTKLSPAETKTLRQTKNPAANSH